MNKCRTTIITNFSGPGTSCSSGTGCSRCRNSINSQLYFAVISISSISGCVTTIAAVTTVTAFIANIITSRGTTISTFTTYTANGRTCQAAGSQHRFTAGHLHSESISIAALHSVAAVSAYPFSRICT